MAAWQEVARQNMFRGYGARNVDRVTYKLPNGNEGDFDIKVEPDVVSILALTTEERILTVRQFRPGPMAILDELPGGIHDSGGTPLMSVRHELRQETGYEAAEVELLAACPQDAYNTRRKWGYVGRECIKVGEQILDSNEFAEVHSWEPDRFIAHVLSGQMTDTEIALMGLVRLGYLKSGLVS